MRRPDAIKERIGHVEQISGVVVAMRAIAAAHVQEARRHLDAIRAQEQTVARAMADALSLLPGAPHTQAGAEGAEHLHIVLGAAQGFCGAYNERVVESVLGQGGAPEGDRFLLIGQRCVSAFESRGVTPVWSANMAFHPPEVPALASRVVDAVFRLLGGGRFARVSILHGDPDSVRHGLTMRQLMPFDFRRFERRSLPDAPMTTLPLARLVSNLVEEYVFTEICEALMLGFAAENDARVRSMTRARGAIRAIRDELRGDYARARQAQTTTEIIELSVE
ncbi:F0F1 ATP synthase subunit gamma [Oceanibium sediminis]|uniref:F0F1 ATP synthase subunit gamma n=1 Tax=Oceanibium sediminis TaxID=2026339 RepID=UPI000DD4810A|nr:FoF1 ATP synthase subunit gamma [Oceanibium sediminis]